MFSVADNVVLLKTSIQNVKGLTDAIYLFIKEILLPCQKAGPSYYHPVVFIFLSCSNYFTIYICVRRFFILNMIFLFFYLNFDMFFLNIVLLLTDFNISHIYPFCLFQNYLLEY